jgi:hypothetical protein
MTRRRGDTETDSPCLRVIFSVSPYLRVFLLLTRVHYDAAADRLIEAVVIDHVLASRVFPPDLDAEGIGGSIASPQHELISIAVGIQRSNDLTAALELGVDLVLAYHQSFIADRAVVEAASMELELGVVRWNGRSLDKTHDICIALKVPYHTGDHQAY